MIIRENVSLPEPSQGKHRSTYVHGKLAGPFPPPALLLLSYLLLLSTSLTLLCSSSFTLLLSLPPRLPFPLSVSPFRLLFPHCLLSLPPSLKFNEDSVVELRNTHTHSKTRRALIVFLNPDTQVHSDPDVRTQTHVHTLSLTLRWNQDRVHFGRPGRRKQRPAPRVQCRANRFV